jgi:hypothetical protein
MLCRHTVPDWHRYVDAGAETVPIFAACRLLVKEGEPARDPRSIGCAYWGRQRECPLYEGPGGRIGSRSGEGERRAAADVAVAPDAVWPVRPPGAQDGWRWLRPGLEAASVALLLGAGVGAVGVLQGKAPGAGYAVLVLAAAGVSIVTLVLGRLRTWARR